MEALATVWFVVCFGALCCVQHLQLRKPGYSTLCPIVVKSSSEAKLRANNTIAREVDVHGTSSRYMYLYNAHKILD